MDLSNLEQVRHNINVNFVTLAVYNFQSYVKCLNDVENELKKLEINHNSLSFIPTDLLTFRNSCHLCHLNYKDIYNYKYCILMSINKNEASRIMEKFRLVSDDIYAKLICEIKLSKNLVCPVLIEKNKEKINFEKKLVDTIENWFSDDEIFKHKDILLSMNNRGWVPLSVIEVKLEEMIIIGTKDLSEKLKESSCLEINENDSLIRRRNTKLPLSIENNQIVLIDIPDSIKSIRQMPAYLQIDGSSVEYFDYSIHSAIITLSSRDQAIRIVNDVLESQKMKAKLMVPSIVDDSVESTSSDQVDVQKVLSSLALKQEPVEIIHTMMLTPDDLTYCFSDSFCPPSQTMIDEIVKQCNFYFSDFNVLKDLFILKKIKSNPGGWIDLNSVAKFKQMVKLSNDSVDNVVYAMCFSDQVQISRDARSLRRRLPLPEWDPSIYTRSLFMWNLPRCCDTYQKLDEVFRVEGRFVVCVSRYIRADRNVPADLRKLCDKILALGNENCGVVEFSSRESMIAANDFIHLKWASVKTFYLDTKEELPKPAVIVSKTSKNLPPPIPISSLQDNRIAPMQAGTRIDPRFWQVAKLLSSRKRTEMKIYTKPRNELSMPFNVSSAQDFPPLSTKENDFFDKNEYEGNNSHRHRQKRFPFKANATNIDVNKLRQEWSKPPSRSVPKANKLNGDPDQYSMSLAIVEESGSP